MSRRKRWVVAHVVQRALGLQSRAADPVPETPGGGTPVKG
jgi:hypothetical protein